MKKECKECKQIKYFTDFYKSKTGAPSSKCKPCTRRSVRDNLKLVGRKYDYSEKGLIRVIYKTQKRHQKLRGHGDLPYSKDELKSWLYNNGFKDKYIAWVNSSHKKNLKPSVDRIDSLKGYSFSNIRLVTWEENKIYQYNDIVNGVGSGGRRCKKVEKLDTKGDVICEYVSYSSAARDCGYSLEYPIKKGTKCKKGYFWRYKDNQ